MKNPLKLIFVILSFFQFLFPIEYNWSYIRSELNPINLIPLDEKVVASYNSFIVEYDYDGDILERIDLKERYNFNSIVNIEADLFNNIWIISSDGEILVLDADYNLKKTFNYLGVDRVESCLNYQNSDDVYSLCSYIDGGNLGLLSFTYNSNGVPQYMDYYSLSEGANYVDMEIVDGIIYVATNVGIYVADINSNLKLPSSWNLNFSEATILALEQYNNMIIILTAENDNINILDENSNILSGGTIEEPPINFLDSKVRGDYLSLLFNNNLLYYEIEPSLEFNFLESKELDNSSYNLLSVNDNYILTSITNQGFLVYDGNLNEQHIISNTSSMDAYNAIVSLKDGSMAAIGTKLNEDQSVDFAGILHYDNGLFINYVPSYFENKYKIDLEDNFNLTALNYHPGEKYCQSVIELEDNHIAFSNSGMRHTGDSKGGLIIIDLDLRKIDDIFNTENTNETLGGQNGIYKSDWNNNYTLINQVLTFDNKIYTLNPYNELHHNPLCIYDISEDSWSAINLGNNNLYLPQGLAIDRNGQIWIGFMNEVTYEPYGQPYSDGGIRLINENYQFTEIDNDEILIGGKGSDVWSLDICEYDNFDILWVLTSEGVQGYTIFQNQLSPVSNTDLFSEIPFYKGDHLKCDQSSNVWITTTHSGVRTILAENNYTDFWPSYDGMTSDNSGLLSNIVYDVNFNFKSGKIYFATDRGVSILHSPFSDVSYNNKGKYKIYFDKNPFIVPADEDLVISNVPLGSTIIIMDLNGNVLRRIKGSNFTQYIWDGRDSWGNYLNSGIYIVASSNPNGKNSISKVAIIRDK